MKILVINGPNINMLGIREPGIYGSDSFETLCNNIKTHAKKAGIEVKLFQSNHEGALIDEVHRAYFEKADGIIINAGGYTHTSVALMD
ncbi:MAG TPA: 3-dehydroquinate dehydratase, partial [Ruminococcaceae bacterium]|nr:3-dehydroquinate dehydratase [Oscillospiraceae bacterium]